MDMEKIFPQTLIDLARSQAVHIDQSRTLTQELLEHCYEEKLFKLFVAEKLGGLMLDLPDALKVFEKASWIDGNLGWAVTIGSGGGYFSAMLPEDEASALFMDRRAVVAGSGAPNSVAERVDGGYQISGSWKYCSGSTYATIFTANCIIDGEMRAVAMLPGQVRIVRDWQAFGLRATDSHSMVAEDAFIPASRTFTYVSEPNNPHPVFRYPFGAFAKTSFGAVALGIGSHFLDAAKSHAEAVQAAGSRNPERLTALQSKIQASEEALLAARTAFYEVVDKTWVDFVASGEMSEQDEQRIADASQRAARAAKEGANSVFPLLGMTALMEDQPLNRIWRDLQVATQHSALVPVSS